MTRYRYQTNVRGKLQPVTTDENTTLMLKLHTFRLQLGDEKHQTRTCLKFAIEWNHKIFKSFFR